MTLQVDSEIGRLRRVLVHEPGPEIDRMVPGMMEQLLFDDILYGDRARDEHARFRRVMQLFGIEVVEANDLLVEALSADTARRWVVERMFRELGKKRRAALAALSARELASVLIVGSQAHEHPAGHGFEELYDIPPLPNWCFQRDPQTVLGNGVVFSSMAAPARHREALLARIVFRFHPELADVPVLFDPMETDDGHWLFVEQQRPILEGGDVLVLSPELLVVGVSERTNRSAVKRLAVALARRGEGPRWLIAVTLPRRRAYMHLDTLLTPIDRQACLVHAPVMLKGGTEVATVYEADLHAGEPTFRSRGALLGVLARRGLDMEPIACGGADPLAQQREQWSDGANALALAPGAITLYDRNLATAEELSRRGFRLVEAESLLLGRAEVDIDRGERVCILLSSHEISRARGGPHCLTHPLRRDRLDSPGATDAR